MWVDQGGTLFAQQAMDQREGYSTKGAMVGILIFRTPSNVPKSFSRGGTIEAKKIPPFLAAISPHFVLFCFLLHLLRLL